jgi:hypothetical protein
MCLLTTGYRQHLVQVGKVQIALSEMKMMKNFLFGEGSTIKRSVYQQAFSFLKEIQYLLGSCGDKVKKIPPLEPRECPRDLVT